MVDAPLGAMHETAKGLHKAGTMNTVTMREFGALCLPPVKIYTPTQIKRLRSVRPETAILAIPGVGIGKYNFPVPPIFNDLQSSKMPVPPCTGPGARLSGRALRRRRKASQAIFAAYLNNIQSTVQKWEQGRRNPNGPSLKLLNLVDTHGLEALV